MSQVNKEEALRALDIAKKRLQSSEQSSPDLAAALRFAKKSSSLYPTNESTSLISKIESLIESKEKKPESSSTSSKGKQNGDAKPTSSSTDGIRNRFTKTSKEKTSSTSTTTSSSTTNKKDSKTEEPKEYTKEQAELVKRVKKCNVTAYYEILQVEKTCEDKEIKKAYRKLALQLHPDKNFAPGADEAFKLVSKAFQILQDADSRSHYDRFGADRPSMSSSAGSSASPGFRSSHASYEEINPDEIFRMFFGNGGGFGGPAGFGGSAFGGPGFTTFYGPGGIRTARFGAGGMPRQQAAGAGAGRGGTQNGNENRSSIWIQLLPLLVLVGFSFFSQMSSFLFNWSEVPDPAFSFQPTSFHTLARSTFTNPSVDYFVNPRQFGSHAIYEDILAKNTKLGFSSSEEPGSSARSEALYKHILENNPIPQSYSPKCQAQTAASDRKQSLLSPVPPVCFSGKFSIPSSLTRYETKVAQTYLSHLKTQCQSELEDRRELLNRYRGFFGVGADWEKYQQVQRRKLEACDKLSAMGYTLQSY